MAGAPTDPSPNPFDGFTVTLAAAGTVAVLDPQPYANTKEVVLLNLSADDAMYVKVIDAVGGPASTTITVTNTDTSGIPVVGDTITIDGNVLTAVGGPRTAATDTFSVDTRATAFLAFSNPTGLQAGDTVKLQTKGGSPGTFITMTAITGVRAAGSLTFTLDSNPTTAANNLITAINDSAFSDGGANCVASGAGTVTLTAGFDLERRGANGNASALSANTDYGLSLSVSRSSSVLVLNDFSGGVNADGGETQPDGSVLYNRGVDIAQNIASALLDAPSFPGTGFGFTAKPYFNRDSSSATAQVVVVTDSAGQICSESATGLTITTPTAGNVPVVTSLSAATSTVIPAGWAITLQIGAEGNRTPLGAGSFSGLAIAAAMESGASGDGDLNVTYVNNRGFPFGV